MESIQAIADRIKGLEEESKQLQVVKQGEQSKHDAIVAETEQLVVNNNALRQLKADQDAHLSPLDVNAVESRVSTATVLPSTVAAGERVEAGDVVVSVRP